MNCQELISREHQREDSLVGMNEVVFCRDEPRLTEKGCMTTMQASLLHGLIKLWVHRLSTHLHTQPYRTFPSVLWKTMSTAY